MKMSIVKNLTFVSSAAVLAFVGQAAWNEGAPRINGSKVYGATPSHEFMYTFPTTGDRNGFEFAVSDGKLPAGVSLDAKRGVLSGSVKAPGSYSFTVRACNALGVSEKPFTLVVGEDARALTPPMGWTSWSAFTSDIDQDLIAATADAIVQKGLAAHGYAYVNIDSCWQGARNKKGSKALQPNGLFPDMGALVKHIHALGLKAGIYSTPWVHAWGSSDTRPLLGSTTYPLDPAYFHRQFGGCGKVSMEKYDAAQFAEWGFDWLKYDWTPTDTHHCRTMREALDLTNRDMILQVCTCCRPTDALEYAKWVQLARGSGDTRDKWDCIVKEEKRVDKWLGSVRPGFWYDLDMLAVGDMRIDRSARSTRPGEKPDEKLRNHFTEDEVAFHFCWWAIIPTPLFLSCDIINISDSTLRLVTNPDLLEINQDYPAKPAEFMDFDDGTRRLWTRQLSDGRTVLGFFNIAEVEWQVSHALPASMEVRDVLPGEDLGAKTELSFTLRPHSCRVLILKPASGVNPS